MTENIGGGRALHVCDLCGGVDDHPRHIVIGAPGTFRITDDVLDKVLASAPAADQSRLVRELLDTSSSDRHLDCCRAAVCPNGTCDLMTDGAHHKRGADLLEHIVGVGDVAPGDDSTVPGEAA